MWASSAPGTTEPGVCSLPRTAQGSYTSLEIQHAVIPGASRATLRFQETKTRWRDRIEQEAPDSRQ